VPKSDKKTPSTLKLFSGAFQVDSVIEPAIADQTAENFTAMILEPMAHALLNGYKHVDDEVKLHLRLVVSPIPQWQFDMLMAEADEEFAEPETTNPSTRPGLA
jgi:hypothetical protein